MSLDQEQVPLLYICNYCDGDDDDYDDDDGDGESTICSSRFLYLTLYPSFPHPKVQRILEAVVISSEIGSLSYHQKLFLKSEFFLLLFYDKIDLEGPS